MTAVGCEKDHKNAKQPPAPEKVAVTSGDGAGSQSNTKAASKEVGSQNNPSEAKSANKNNAPVTAKSVPTPAPAKRIEGVVAKVNGVIIDDATFYAEVDRISRRNPRIPADRLARIESNILRC